MRSSSENLGDSVVVNKHIGSDPELRRLLASQFYHIGTPPALYIYPMFENAYAAAKGRTADEQLPRCAELFSRFSVIAAAQPEHSWYPEEKTKEWLMQNPIRTVYLATHTESGCAREMKSINLLFSLL